MEGLEIAPVLLGSGSAWLNVGLAAEETALIPTATVEATAALSRTATVTNKGPVGKLGRITHYDVDGGVGLPRYFPNFGRGQNWELWRKIGAEGENLIRSTREFMGRFGGSDKNAATTGSRLRPDNTLIDEVNKVIRIGEIKPGTKTGLLRGIRQLERYANELQKKYPDYDIELELWTYRAFVTVGQGETLSGISKKYETSIDRLLKLNPSIKNPDLIKAGQEIMVEEMKGNLPTGNINDCSDNNCK